MTKIIITSKTVNTPDISIAPGRWGVSATCWGRCSCTNGRWWLRDWPWVAQSSYTSHRGSSVNKIRINSLQSHHSCLTVINTKILPVQQVSQPFCPIPLDNSLPPVQLGVVEHESGQLPHTFLHWLQFPVNAMQDQNQTIFFSLPTCPRRISHKTEGPPHVLPWSSQTLKDW